MALHAEGPRLNKRQLKREPAVPEDPDLSSWRASPEQTVLTGAAQWGGSVSHVFMHTSGTQR